MYARALITLVLAAVVMHPAGASRLSDRASRDVAEQVSAALPDAVSVRTLAILEIEDDTDGAVGRALVVALQAHGDFVLVEKANIQRVLDEHRWQLSDLHDPDTRVRFGRLVAAEGLLFGRVVESTGGFMSHVLRAQVQVDDVQRGTVAFARDFESRVETRSRDVALLGLLGASALALGGSVLVRAWRRRPHEQVADGGELRGGARVEVQRALQACEQAGQVIVADEALALRVRDLWRQLDLLRQAIDDAPAGHPQLQTRARVATGLRADRNAAERVHAIAEGCAALRTDAAAGRLDDVDEAVDGLLEQVAAARAVLIR